MKFFIIVLVDISGISGYMKSLHKLLELRNKFMFGIKRSEGRYKLTENEKKAIISNIKVKNRYNIEKIEKELKSAELYKGDTVTLTINYTIK